MVVKVEEAKKRMVTESPKEGQDEGELDNGFLPKEMKTLTEGLRLMEVSLTGLDPAPTYSPVQWETQGLRSYGKGNPQSTYAQGPRQLRLHLDPYGPLNDEQQKKLPVRF
ncbi:hypothetical protein VNO77_03594 [Canavalia gladiata]|uniref:Uncharacterized protein n=1 Tax=Canavalia gladiata TaxID=3824 RepID=A0AAN9MUY6_CANGL